jgi:hypothetical protein
MEKNQVQDATTMTGTADTTTESTSPGCGSHPGGWENWPASNMTWGTALLALQAGGIVARAGWNGKGMFLYLVPAASYPAIHPAARAVFGDTVPYGAYIAMKTAQNNVVPWLASQTDILADDWCTIPLESLQPIS